MRRIDVEASSDHADGSRVAILLRGVETVPESAAVFLRPQSPDGSDLDLGDLANEQWPVATRIVDDGLELVMGPEIAQHHLLTAGTRVEIEVPDAEVWSELVWPQLAQRARTRRRNILAGRVAGEPHETHPQPTQPAARPAIAPGALDATRGTAATAPQTSMPATTRDGANMTSDVARAGPATADLGALSQAQPSDYVTFYPHARGGRLGAATSSTPRRAGSLLPTTRWGAAITAVIAVLAAQGLLWLGAGGHLGTGATPSATAGKTGGETSLFELLSAGQVSPRGVAAREVVPVKALENAQAALLTPGTPRDSEEAAYWLRRYLGSGGVDERTRRVLTQLGSTYADSTNRNVDFVRARQIWELAGALGDPVAMCFLGTLHENGLATQADRKAALGWFERAKASGGCPAVDEAIARLR